MITSHTQFSREFFGYNLLNNGAFTQYADRWVTLDNDREEHSTTRVDTEHYRQGSAGFISNEPGQLGFWDVTGVTARLVVSPTTLDGFIITSRDGGNVLKIIFNENGELLLTQEIIEPKRLEGHTLSSSISGLNMTGEPVINLSVVVDGSELAISTASGAALGSYRRFGGSVQLPDQISDITYQIRITGCAGEEVGIAGVSAILGHESNNVPFISSFVDRAVPSGITFMVAGDSCPQGYAAYDDDLMVLVSGTKAVQSVGGKSVTVIGSDTHDHQHGTINALLSASTELTGTVAPLSPSETSLVRGIPFHDYPNNVPFIPYSGEIPVVVQGTGHTHNLRTDMTCVPPTFPIKLCKKL